MIKRVAALMSAVLVFFLTGCADMQDIDTRVYLSAIGIDKSKEGYSFCFQTASPVGMTNAVESNMIKYSNYTVDEKNLSAALSALRRKLTGKLDTEHLICVVIGKSLGDESVIPLIAPLFEDPSVRRQCNVVCSDSSAADIFSKNGSNSLEISRLLESYAGNGASADTSTIWNLFCAKENKSSYYLHRLSIKKDAELSDSDKYPVEISGVSFFDQNGKLCSFDAQQALVIRLLAETLPKGELFLFSEEPDVAFEIVDSARKIRLCEDEEGGKYFEIDLSVVCSDMNTEEMKVREFENKVLEALSAMLLDVIDECLRSGAYGAIGLENEYRQKYYNEFMSLSDEEKSVQMRQIPVKLKLRVRLERAEGYR